MNTPGPWRKSDVQGDAVVSDFPTGDSRDDESSLMYYGGRLIAESVAPNNRALIAAAPMLAISLMEIVNEYAGVYGADQDKIARARAALRLLSESR